MCWTDTTQCLKKFTMLPQYQSFSKKLNFAIKLGSYGREMCTSLLEWAQPWHLKEGHNKKTKRWPGNQQMIMWLGLTSTQRQAQEMNLGPSLAARTRLLYFNSTQSWAVTGLLTGHNNTLKKHLYIMGLIDSLACKRCGAEEETSAHILCQCEALATLRHMMGSFFFNPQDVRSLSLGVISNFIKQRGFP